MSATHSVSSLSLNLRSTPKAITNGSNILLVLPQGQLGEKLEETSESNWWKIATTFLQTQVVGFVNKKYLIPVARQENGAHQKLEAVHLSKNSPDARRHSTFGRAFPLSEMNKPSRDITSPSTKITSLHAIIDWLQVEQSPRFQPKRPKTFCNIYACDYCYLSDAYLPRVWWTDKTIAQLKLQIPQKVLYGQTVRELNANSLFEWLEDYGTDFGWQRTLDINELQEAANEGFVCIVSAQNADLNASGHICAVVPEHSEKQAKRVGGKVQIPLQSQAGAKNQQYFNDQRWWLSRRFRNFGYWMHA